MIRVHAPSRLHFGLLGVGPGPGSDDGPVSGRRFGGVGLMIQSPGLRLAISPAPAWSAEGPGPLCQRALKFAQRFSNTLPPNLLTPQRLHIEQAPPEHVGLGTGTQLGLAVARALAAACGMKDMPVSELARRVGRGLRSGLGIHGFAQGGFLVEAGKREGEVLAPLVARIPFPEDWRVVLVFPPGPPGLHGDAERRAFHNLENNPQHPEALCQIVLLDLLPALVEKDLEAFGEALHQFNARAGESFASIQGGAYSSPQVAELVAFARRQGVRGAGQSSWGPGVFAFVKDEEQAANLANLYRLHFSLTPEVVLVTKACNHGAEVVTESL